MVRAGDFQRTEHGNGWTQAAHRDFFFAANIEKPARTEIQDLFDGQTIFPAGGGIVFVMIEIGGSEKEYIRLSGKNLAERFSNRDQLVKVNAAKSDGNKCEARIPDLQKRKLDFKGMFAFVGDRIFVKQRTSARNSYGEIGVYGNIAERSAPRAFRQDGGFLALGEMANS